MQEPVIAVGILSGPEVRFALEGPFRCGAGADDLTGAYTARVSDGNVRIEGGSCSLSDENSVLLEPRDKRASAFRLSDVTIGVQFHWERKEEQRFVGSLRLVRSGSTLVAINLVPVEEYLASVISSEMSAGSSLALLKAHAITSRSWLLAQIEKSRALKAAGAARPVARFEENGRRIRWYDREDHELFDVCADDHCQRYQGITRVTSPAVAQAVRETRGQVLMHAGAICDARFSKACGGVSELFENVWEPVHHPYLIPVLDAPASPGSSIPTLTDETAAGSWIRSAPPAFCNTHDPAILSQVLVTFDRETTDFFRWNVQYSQAELAGLVHEKSGIDFGDILDLVPVKRGPSGRIIELKIVGSKRTMIIGKELEIRKTLSPSHLYSSAFVVDALDRRGGVPGRFVLTGAGWGHGVGLCQIGAAVMGEQGSSHEDILRHYFTGAAITTLY